MGSSLLSSLVNTFLAYHKENWFDKCSSKYKPLYYPRYVDDMFILLNNCYLKSCHVNMSFLIFLYHFYINLLFYLV